MSNVTIYTVSKIEKECPHLFEAYWNEADERRDSCSVDINFESYAQLERAGMLKIFAYLDQDKVVGFVVYTISPCPHTRAIKAVTEISYVLPEYRGTGVIDEMFKMADRYFKATGVSQVFMTLKVEFPHDSLPERTGFKHVENVYMKEF